MIQLAYFDLTDTQIDDFKFNFDGSKYIEIICNQNWLNWLLKPLTEMKKDFEKPQQLGLF
jgi:hypothetical protein